MNETVLQVNTSRHCYPIAIVSQGFEGLVAQLPTDATALVLVSNQTVWAHYGQAVQAVLAKHGAPVHHVLLPDGEAFKTLDTLNQLYTALLQAGVDRRGVLLALGGGVIGDMVGFAAATYQRGVRFIQVPTTLLAQVDSAVGGKTAVNHPLGKNMIGAFYPPIGVYANVATLQTLPERELSAGLAEVLKYGCIMDVAFLDWFEAHVPLLRQRDAQALSTAIAQSCTLKAKVVQADEQETGWRAILNFGHTFGHAIEAALGYGQWLHGEAVGCGMVMAAQLSQQLGLLPQASVQRIIQLVQAIGCPVQAPALPEAQWLGLMRGDKKAQGGQIRVVVLNGLGQAQLQTVTPEQLRSVLVTMD